MRTTLVNNEDVETMYDIHKMCGSNFIQINVFINSERSSAGDAGQRFSHAIDQLYSEQAAKWVEDSDPNHWANALFSGERYGEMYSNCAESFNSWILEARNLPIVQMVDHIRVQMMELLYQRRIESSNWKTFLCPSIMEKLQKIHADSRGLQVRCSDEVHFEVRGRRNEAVNLSERTCTCRGWQVYGLPCVHACAAVWKINGTIHEYCSHYFRADLYRQAYAAAILPVVGVQRTEGEGGDILIKPPLTKIRPGRKKKNWIESQADPDSVSLYRCSR
ncbi:hypothetical protein QJS10_CPA06g01165 [Acorus calamus]|uniref:SWIM-type domain-containing protein n=1 Tax=Acorus calamus TaxID=4465 RepID=A0AAV9EKN1_ACOCL|nr:hypothetical protein QJS10_CPA06g01165 [Acorus calamus]